MPSGIHLILVEMAGLETSGTEFINHWKWAADKGLMNRNTAGATRAAVAQVLGAIGDPSQIDVRQLDIEDALRRFENMKKKEFTPDSLRTYKSRFRQAVASYLSYLDDPGGWRPQGRPAAGARARLAARQSREHEPSPAGPAQEQPVPTELQRGRMMDYPFPLGEGVIAHLVLPLELTPGHVKRLMAFMNTLLVDGD